VKSDRPSLVAIILLAILGGGIIYIMKIMVMQDGAITGGDTGEIVAGFLSIREIISKIEKIARNIGADGPVSERE
jgi:hypothetical protein